MAKDTIGSYSPIQSIRPGRNRLAEEEHRQSHQEFHEQSYQGGKQATSYHGRDVFHDDVSVLGIPEPEMTEHVRAALGKLLSEINHLRDEIIALKGQDSDSPALTVLPTRAFMAQLDSVVRQVQANKLIYCCLFIAITNAAKPEDRERSAELFGTRLSDDDFIGNLEDSNLGITIGIILAGTSLLDADQKGRDLVKHLKAQMPHLHGQFGVADIVAGDKADDVLNRAQNALISHQRAVQEI